MWPAVRDSLALVGCVAFVLLFGLLVAVGAMPWQTAIVGIGFFGFGGLVLGRLAVVKARMARNLSTQGLVEAAPGKLHEDRVWQIALGVGLLAMGALGVWGGRPFGPVFVLCSAIAAAFGAWTALGTALGFRAMTWLAFEPDGLRVLTPDGERFARWDGIRSIALAEFNQNPIVQIRTDGADDITIWPLRFGVDAALLARAIDTYARVPEARAALGRKAIAAQQDGSS